MPWSKLQWEPNWFFLRKSLRLSKKAIVRRVDLSTLAQVPIISSGIIIGIIMFQTVIVAPSLFRYVNYGDTSTFLRSVFPKMFLLIAAISLISFLVSLVIKENTFFIRVISLITIISMVICYLIIPATNRAKDAKKEFVFRRLHTISVVLTVMVLLANFSLAFL